MKRLHIITLAVLAASVLALGVTTLVRSIETTKQSRRSSAATRRCACPCRTGRRGCCRT